MGRGELLVLLMGSQPPAMLAFVPVCGSVNPPALASHWATSLRLSDLAVCWEGFSHRRGNWFIRLSIIQPSKVFDWPGLPRKRGGERARDYGIRNSPGEKGGLSSVTSQPADGKSCRNFYENRKLSLCSYQLSVVFKYFHIFCLFFPSQKFVLWIFQGFHFHLVFSLHSVNIGKRVESSWRYKDVWR